MLGERAHRARAQVRDRADVEHGAPVGELPNEAVVLDGADAVPQAVGPQRLEGAPDRGRARVLARVRDRAEALGACERERALVGLWRVFGLAPAEADGDDAPLSIGGRVTDDRLGLFQRRTAEDVRREANRDAVQLLRLLGAVAVAA